MKTVWVVEMGEYSDYRVVGVYTSKMAAEGIAKYLTSEGSVYDVPSVAEWPLNPGIDTVLRGYKCFAVHMLSDGTTEKIFELERWSTPHSEFSIWPRSTAEYYKGKNVPDCLSASVWAQDAEHAIKITNEKRTQMIASGEWK